MPKAILIDVWKAAIEGLVGLVYLAYLQIIPRPI